MASLRFADMQSRPTEFLDFTSLTLDEFQQLVPPFEAAFQAHMAAWRLDGKPRTARQFSVYQNCPLADTRRSAVLSSDVSEDLRAPSGPGTPVRHGPEQSQSVDSRALAGAAGGPAHPWRCPHALSGRSGAAPRRLGGRRGPPLAHRTRRRAGVPPFAHDGTARRIVRPQDPAEQTDCYSGKKRDHTVKNVLLVTTPLTILFLSATSGGRVHDKRIADATAYSGDSCHPIQCKAATQSEGKLPPNPVQSCHPIRRKAATESRRRLPPHRSTATPGLHGVMLRSRRFAPSRDVYASNLLCRVILYALWSSRSRMASASVGSPSTSCQCSTGN